ncbi:Ribonuclease [Actinidia chinensis var. chinensis]|uniref:Ribonuclease n=1 Tax=Actinidia chinensis var. chinensis TaxID=1590841 RepID=A0A2R6QSP9_ACTCC|nr:Ribonuclease [Actinidia chinensis var. chinensis]
MASLPTTQIILSLQSLVLLIASVHGNGGVVEARKEREFDYFALSLQWPGTYCQKTRHCCSSNACFRGWIMA